MTLPDIGYGPGRRLFAKGTVCTKEEDKTRQSDRDAADINKIVRKFDFEALNAEYQARLDRGEPPWTAADVTNVTSYEEMWQRVAEATQYFEQLPPEVRYKFDNDPRRMIAAYEKQELREVFEEIGLLDKEPEVLASRAERGARESSVEAPKAGIVPAPPATVVPAEPGNTA